MDIIIWPALLVLIIGLAWMIIGVWICWKRNFYAGFYEGDHLVDLQVVHNLLAVLFMPLNLMFIVTLEFILGDWDNSYQKTIDENTGNG